MRKGVGCQRFPVLTVIRFPIFRVTNLLLGRETGGLQRRAKISDSWIVEIYKNRNGLWLELRDTIPAIFVNLGWGMRPIPLWEIWRGRDLVASG
ncbi:hypothetical protein GBA52_024466 [Prunus armeniaca]|nr:hypothetical protein GBA52_024466 [Prunus armeniaca]